MHILAQVVCVRTPKLHLWHETCFREATTALIGRYHGAAAVRLYSLIEQALLENANIHLDVSFARRDKHGADVVAQLPPFVSRLPYHIRHLEFPVKVEIPLNRLNYPIDIFGVTRGQTPSQATQTSTCCLCCVAKPIQSTQYHRLAMNKQYNTISI